MTDMKTYFASPEKATEIGPGPVAISTSCEQPAPSPTEKEKCGKSENSEERIFQYVVKIPRPNSKLILQNMEEVLNSVKKKHRQKHRRKREQKKLAQLEAEAVAVAAAEAAVGEMGTPSLGADASNNGEKLQHNKAEHKERRRHKKRKVKPLQEKSVQENDQRVHRTTKRKDNKSPLKSVSPNGGILKHFPPTPKKSESEIKERNTEKETESAKPVSGVNFGQQRTTNAFEVMMNARNRTIGSNTPGKESPAMSSTDESQLLSAAKTTKRKAVLQDWADRKGAMKRKLDEESRAAYVDKQLENRAKRFKQMLVNGASPTNNSTPKRVEKSNENVKEKKAKKTVDTSSSATGEQQCKRARRRRRRLSSQDSTGSIEISCSIDAETAEFLSKLSSPTKKRDSLLGYFSKKESQSAEDTKVEKKTIESVITNEAGAKSDTPKSTKVLKRARRSAAGCPSSAETSEKAESNEEKLDELEVKHTPSGRPKRSCVGKARYDFDLQEISPKRKTTAVGKDAEQGQVTPEVINLDDSCSSITSQNTPKKLAPLFVRAMPKPCPDPATLKARQDFLMSGVPEKMRQELIKQKQYEQTLEEAYECFPTVSHVHQLSKEERKTENELKFKLRSHCEEESTPHYHTAGANRRARNSKIRNSTNAIVNCSVKEIKLAFSNSGASSLRAREFVWPPLVALENKRNIIKTWKAEYERFPTYKCYNQLREKYRYFSAIDSAQDTEQVNESFMVTRRTRRSLDTHKQFDPEAEEDKPPSTAPNGELLFTEKYKPMLFEQVLVNLMPVTQLRDFLANWANGNGSSARNSQNLDESLDSANESNSSQQSVCNSVVLLGPVSSGKTNAVFALANDMNFNVLEVNAGMKRTGKKLIQELQEATQSHQIRKDSVGVSHGKAQKNLLKMSLNGLKYKKQHSQQSQDGESGGDSSQSSRKCLILIEDADVVFDQTDAGFTDAIYTLVASSKRPVIVVATNQNCPHLQRLMNQNTIKFSSPNALSISKFLSVLSLIENCPIQLDDITSMYLYNRRDLRKTLLELQFFIQSGGDDRHEEVAAITLAEKKNERGFFASPTKRKFSEDSISVQEKDEQLSKDKDQDKDTNKRNNDTKNETYMHGSFFKFYTTDQNIKWRIPFPVDFHLLSLNLHGIFQASRKLIAGPEVNNTSNVNAASSNTNTNGGKRKSRSPKKAWINSVNSSKTDKNSTISPLEAICTFYENASVASLLATQNQELAAKAHGCHFGDRLVPHLSERIAHCLVEKAIDVNLSADPCPYNLFDDSREERYALCDNMGLISLRTRPSRRLDFEPALRAICRSEKLRSTQERRSTRFYHYLRHTSVNILNFSTEPFDRACDVFQESKNNSEDTSEQQSPS